MSGVRTLAEHTHVPLRAILISFLLIWSTASNFWQLLKQDDAKFKKYELHKTINKFTWYKHLVNVDKVWYWKVHRPFPALCESRAGIVGDCTILWFSSDPHLSRSIRILGSPAYHMDAQRLKLAQSMPRSTVQAFLTKFGISGREEGGWQWRGRAREEGASIVFNADLIL